MLKLNNIYLVDNMIIFNQFIKFNEYFKTIRNENGN